MFYRRKKTQDTYFFFFCKVVDDNSAVFFQAKKIRKKYCVEKKNDYYTILNAFFSEGAKVGFFSLVQFGWTNKLRQNQNICSNSNAFCVLIKTFIF